MKHIISFATFLLLSYGSIAQNNQPATNQNTIKLDQNATVKNMEGQEYPYAVWNKLFQSGKYGVKLTDAKNPQKPVFMIYEMSQQEIEARNERMPKPRESGSFKDGDVFMPFNFKDTKNNKFKAEDLAGKVIVLNFWFINCPPCRQEMPDLNELVEKYKDKEVFFIAMALDSWSDIDEFTSKTPFNYHILPDSRYLATKYGVKSYPTHVVIDKSNKVIFQTTGLGINTVYWVEKSIDKALNE